MRPGVCVLAALAFEAHVARADQSELQLPEPVLWSLSSYAAGLYWFDHPTRVAGGEAELRLDGWQSGVWSFHLSYVPDVIVDTPEAGSSVEDFHDLNLGGSWRPSPKVPLWFWGEGHALLGGSTAWWGGGFLAGIGASWKGLTLDLGAGGVFLQAESGWNVTGRLAWSALPWLSLSALVLVTEATIPGGPVLPVDVAYGAGVRLGPFSGVSLDLSWIGGQRVLALDDLGASAASLPDTIGNTFRISASFPMGRRWAGFAGLGLMFATQPPGNTYELGSAFFGATYFF